MGIDVKGAVTDGHATGFSLQSGRPVLVDIGTPSGGSAGSVGTIQKSDGSGGFVASQIVDNGTTVTVANGQINTPAATPLHLTSDTGVALGAFATEGQDTLNAGGLYVNGNPVSGGGAVTAVAGAATLNAQNGIVTSEPLTSANSYTLTLTNSVIKEGSAILVSGYDGTNIWAPTAIAITTGAAAISLHSLSSPSNSTIQIAFAVFN